MPLQVLQRPRLDGTPIELGDLFRVHKNRREARAVLFTHQLGWEVRRLVCSQLEVVQTQVCRDQEDVLTTGERWKAALAERVAVMSASDRDDLRRRSQLVVDRGLAVPRDPRAVHRAAS